VPIVAFVELPGPAARDLIAAGVTVVSPERPELLLPILEREVAIGRALRQALPAGARSDLTERPLRDLIELFDGIVYELDGETYAFTYVSPSAEGLLGYPVAEWYEPGFWPRRVHPDDIARADAFWLEEASARRAHVLEYRWSRRMAVASGSTTG
jgi:PAS domain-containing protein